MSAGSFHMALFESAAARRDRRRTGNHANGRVLMNGALDQITGHDANPNFTDHSDVRRCGCGSARGAVGHAQPDPEPDVSRTVRGVAGSGTTRP
ncbi:hypothetical protein SEA_DUMPSTERDUDE_47 [Gordonia phage DumpsterDude]|uniref:Uncharacterized protein n=1 Tax=Gordonia phage DumpsterDude TaxID=2713262 RepID=A0A6G8R0A2_9CAUD|nr:hypothetical protein JZX77_gp47 [Gordonia phage DumpsterDude]QIN93635.1 hypothetical protein SEA_DUMPSTERDUDE_47 [Gordonia phage DumpsterDude]